ncbi:class I SAM-dependent methyltransferase [Robiginitalea sp. SC105]|uniref:class I SAM-dependent methyltransferase n=1 Tax=Robiginitalea sp. SC105 TaxID=2762332 RepID=UPI00163970E3|nr:class I SAM-dependent methyltransferase [Robiginitalea sp. SC105]MBC2839478.1 methyltransferase domain-containing protein [Robiginitalea sp. SC105]
MKQPKDLFSDQAADYRRFRPSYPARLLQDIAALAPGRGRALDCATGNGQVARALATYFESVDAVDISEEQLKRAPASPGVTYSRQRAEATGFPDDSFDLIAVAQGIHWFDIPQFHLEARRLLRPGGILAVWGYGLLRVEPRTDAWLDRFYREVTGPYWEPERTYVEAGYANLPFPWEELTLPATYTIRRELGLEDIAGYLYSWSATQHLLRTEDDPVPEWIGRLKTIWGGNLTREGRHDIFLRIGRAAQ